MMDKNYQHWHKVKTEIENALILPSFNEREIWWCSVGLNIGTEEDGKHELLLRPVLVLRKFSREGFWGIPTTSKRKVDQFHQILLLHNREISAILSQIRMMSGKRLRRRIGKISRGQMKVVVHGILRLLRK